ncbi:MAG: flavodoxin family protein, partial [Firmicutes bacterium]|nr:flavodoxin family protein [Bacillota bacterium]
MKTLIINGSPKKDSDTSFLINSFLKDSTGEVVFFNCFFENFSACIACKKCRDGVCKKSDDMQKLYKELENCDNIIIASPVYFGNLTPPVLSVLSRLQCYYKNNFKTPPKIGKEKNGILILTAGNNHIMY